LATTQGRPALLQRYDVQVDESLQVLTLIRNNTELQTSDIQDMVDRVRKTAEELDAAVKDGWRQTAGNKVKQNTYELFAIGGGEREFDRLLEHLKIMMQSLDQRVSLRLVEMTGSLEQNVRTSLHTMTRIDRDVQDIKTAGLHFVAVSKEGLYAARKDHVSL
jgi:hypothetical protein